MTSFKINLASILDLKPRPISCMRLNEDTKLLALYRGGDFGSIELWDVAHQPVLIKQLIDLELIDGKPSVESIVWARGRLFSGGLHGFIVEHDLRTRKIKNKTAATSGPVWCLAVKPDGSQLAAGTEDGFINIFDIVDDGLMYVKVLDRQEGRVLCIDWSPCGNYIASGSVDSVRLWDVDKGHAIQRLITGRSKNKETIVWSIVMLDNLTVVSGDSRGIVSFWDGRVGVLKFKLVTHKADILTLKLSQDKTQLYAAGVDPTVIIMTRIGNSEKWVKSHPRVMHTNDVLTLETCGKRLFSGGMDADFVMSSFPPKVVSKFPPFPKLPFIFDSESLAMVQGEASVNVWKLPNPESELQKMLEFQTKGGVYIFTSCLNPSGTLFAISTLKYIRVFALDHGSQATQTPPKLMRLPLEDKEHVIPNTFWHLTFLNDRQILAVSVDGRKAVFIKISKVFSNAEVVDYIAGPFEEEKSELIDGIDDLQASADGNYLSVNCNSCITVYKIDSDSLFQKMVSVPHYYARVTSTAFHPSKSLLLLTFSDHSVQVYDFEIGKIIFCEKIKKKFDDLQPLLGSSWVDNGNAAVMFQSDGLYLLKMQLNEEPLKKSRKGAGAPRSEKEMYDFCVKSSEYRHKYLSFIGCFNSGQELLAVEINPNSILEKLPPAFAKKRFGA